MGQNQPHRNTSPQPSDEHASSPHHGRTLASGLSLLGVCSPSQGSCPRHLSHPPHRRCQMRGWEQLTAAVQRAAAPQPPRALLRRRELLLCTSLFRQSGSSWAGGDGANGATCAASKPPLKGGTGMDTGNPGQAEARASN